MPKTPPQPPSEDAAAAARATAAGAGLVYVNDDDPGYSRRRAGKGFSYRDPRGATVRDARTLARIRALAIPPAYEAVWICRSARGHLQATGRDARGRKQYRYHPDWARERDAGKFERIVAFGMALPKLRRRLRRDLSQPGFPRAKVAAIVVALMADTLVRVGNDAYARDNGSYGLTTLRDRHLRVGRDGTRLRFRGKGGQDHDVAIGDAKLAKLVRACQQLPGQVLFQYRDDDGAPQPLTSTMVNDYLREAMGEDFTAKDFRTWGGTLQAFRQFAATPLPAPGVRSDRPSERALRAAERAVVAAVAGVLGNTVSVCRKAYIEPSVIAGWRDGSVAALARGARGARQWEQATLRFLRRTRRRR